MQSRAILAAGELGLFTSVVDGSAEAPCVPLADRFERIDLKDRDGVEAFARRLREEGLLDGVMTAGTDFSATVAWVAERLSLPGIPYEAALDASDKGRMRRRFREAGLPSPAFTVMGPDRDFRDLLPEIGPSSGLDFPLVVKPADNMGSRGCRRVDCLAELEPALEDARAFSRSGTAIVEAYMEGKEFSVDAIIHHGEVHICGLADRHIFFPPYFIEMGHTMPTDASREQRDAVLEVFRSGVAALGLSGPGRVGAAKGDIKLTANGAMIGEIAARLSGGYMSGWTYPYASGVDPARAAVLLAVGLEPGDLRPARDWTGAERAFISIPGTVREILGTEAARQVPHVRDLFMRVGPGSKVNFPENNVSKCGNAISAAESGAEAVRAAERAARKVLIRLDPEDPATGEFLAGIGERFPPDAFPLDDGLRKLLEAMPETATRVGGFALMPFPELRDSGLRDWAGRDVPESIEAVAELSGLSLPEIRPGEELEGEESSDTVGMLLGRSFWSALVRGGYQGGTYYLDRLGTASRARG